MKVSEGAPKILKALQGVGDYESVQVLWKCCHDHGIRLKSASLEVGVLWLYPFGETSSRYQQWKGAYNEKVPVSVYGGETEINHYEEIEKGFLSALEANGLRGYRLVDSSELTTELLENRNGITVIERCIGMAINAEAGDGVILNSSANSGWYIACPTDGCYIPYKIGDYQMRDGTVFLSYMVYNPDNNYIDDIMERYDFILDRGLEVGGMYEFRHINGHIEVFLDGEFQFSADTMQEAYSELKAG